MKTIIFRYGLLGAAFGAAAVLGIGVALGRPVWGGVAAVLVLLGAYAALQLSYRRICERLATGESGFPELRLLRARLKEQERDLFTIQENMQEGLILLDREGRIMSMNRSAAALLRAEPGNCVGQRISSVSTHPAAHGAVDAALRGTRREETLEVDGTAVSLYADPVFVEGQIRGVVLLLFEVSEKLAAEQMRREFTANVSHELKTPLTAVSGYAELLKEGLVQPEDVREVGGAIWSESARLLALIDDILDLSRLDESESLPEREEVELLALSREICTRLVPAAESYAVSLTASGTEGAVSGNRRMLDEMITNLAENALKYNHPGGHAEIAIRPTAEGVCLTVSDNGIGIAREHQRRVFERFYRVDKSRSKSTGGTGLGLSIVKHAAALHGAAVKLESLPGYGTAVSVLFPLEGGQGAAPGSRSEAAETS